MSASACSVLLPRQETEGCFSLCHPPALFSLIRCDAIRYLDPHRLRSGQALELHRLAVDRIEVRNLADFDRDNDASGRQIAHLGLRQYKAVQIIRELLIGPSVWLDVTDRPVACVVEKSLDRAARRPFGAEPGLPLNPPHSLSTRGSRHGRSRSRPPRAQSSRCRRA